MARSESRLYELLEPVVEALEYELVGIEYLAQGRHSLLRIYIDKPDGITVDDCARVSDQVSAVLDVEDPIQGHYTLEVSSPGVERPLFTLEHFTRVVGHQIQLRLGVPLDGRRKFKGKLLAVEGETLLIEVDGTEYSIDHAQVDKANLVPEW